VPAVVPASTGRLSRAGKRRVVDGKTGYRGGALMLDLTRETAAAAAAAATER